ncbi:DNA replication protein psf2 [Neophaeococcomyces mojaviensis]|uniref:DNA replication protein psf2 n=1 Tax=Neophaeococcomyces mojaviensis TaxID=3383035 RepID=A0ACC2ZRR6_9EURO|nr:DNA replication protein psf2 [Knufia sp. JES_112]
MAFPHRPGLLPAEVAFLCEMELVTIIPRQRLDRLDLLGGPTNALIPPQRATLPLWLALLLKRQRRINVLPPPWLDPENLREILELETTHFGESFTPAPALPALDVDPLQARREKSRSGLTSGVGGVVAPRLTDAEGRSLYLSPPFVASCTADAAPNALPYHYLEFSQLLLDAAPDDLQQPDTISNLLRDIREVRQAKMRRGYEAITDGSEGVNLDGVGAMEVSESRGFITDVMGGLRMIGASREAARREREQEERESGARRGAGRAYDGDEEDEDMS